MLLFRVRTKLGTIDDTCLLLMESLDFCTSNILCWYESTEQKQTDLPICSSITVAVNLTPKNRDDVKAFYLFGFAHFV
jgi:hypothetical protein